MNKKVSIAIMISIILALAGVFFLRPQQSEVSIAAEKRFIEEMIPHHESAIEMANQAPQQAQYPETKTLAANITAAQQKEANDMRAWYKKWYNADVPLRPADPHSVHGGEPPEGAANFDEGFVAMMIPHHESAVKMAKGVLANAWHKEIKDLANSIVQSQSAEIRRMKQYQKKWQKAKTGNAGPLTITHSEKGFDKPVVTLRKGTAVRFVTTRKDQPMYVATDVHPEHTLYPEFEQAYILGDFPGLGAGFTFTFNKEGRWPYHDHNDAALKGLIVVRG